MINRKEKDNKTDSSIDDNQKTDTFSGAKVVQTLFPARLCSPFLQESSSQCIAAFENSADFVGSTEAGKGGGG